MYRILFLFSFAFYTALSWADCQKLAENLAKKLHPKAKLQLSNCKVWPYSPDKTLVIMTLDSEIPDKDPDIKTYDTDIVVVNSASRDIIGHLYKKKAFYNDAIIVYDVGIDTARYQLNSATRAFGVRLYRRNYARYNNFWTETLHLYYLQDNTPQQVLRGLNMAEAYGEWDEKCSGTFKDIKRVLAIDKKQLNGFNSLKISEVITNSRLKTIKQDDCDKVAVSIKKRSEVLRYNGRVFVVPERLKDVLN